MGQGVDDQGWSLRRRDQDIGLDKAEEQADCGGVKQDRRWSGLSSRRRARRNRASRRGLGGEG